MANKRRCLICTDLSKLEELGFIKLYRCKEGYEYRKSKIRINVANGKIEFFGFNLDVALTIIKMAKLDIIREGSYIPAQISVRQRTALEIMEMVDEATRKKIEKEYFN